MITSELKALFEKEDAIEIAEETILPKYEWHDVQQALFSIMKDSSYTTNDYQIVADIFVEAIRLDKQIDAETAIALLYYRLGDKNVPYENNTIWSITVMLKGLDYANSEYNPLEDPAIQRKLASMGMAIA